MPLCQAANCERSSYGRGLCQMHYMRFRRHGSPDGGGTAVGEPHRYLADTVLKFDDDSQCLIWPFGKNGRGYGTIAIDGKSGNLNRLVCREVYGQPRDDKQEVAHSCGNGHLGCCNPRHLRWASSGENWADRVRHGANIRSRAKLSLAQVAEIKELRGLETQKAIGLKFGVHPSVVSHIFAGRRWSL